MHPTLRCLLMFAGLAGSTLALDTSGPAEAKAYEPLMIVQTRDMIYPPTLTNEHIFKGEVNVAVWVDENGRLLDWLLVGYTHSLFAKEVLDVLPKWKYVPAHLQGQPVPTRAELRIIFQNTEMVRIVASERSPTEQAHDQAIEHRVAPHIYRPDELDAPLDAIVEIMPSSPDRLGAVAREGSVVVEYLVDAEGRVRMPIIDSSDDEAFTNSVLLAITEWRYAVPKRTGHPVIARVKQRFTFSPAS
ncbi:MAG TPA: TonB family protein [Lacunisphaera sp.]|jgi:TonB family protein|nr:TonB family protein [Lacunisphaera sp.]